VENEGVQVFLCMKKGRGAKIFVQYKYLPRMTLLYHKIDLQIKIESSRTVVNSNTTPFIKLIST
jgi:hypothetical protein